MESAIFPLIVFAAVYFVITFELVNKAVAALLGVMVLLIFNVLDEHKAVTFIDFETIMLLLGMMTIVAVLRRSHFFSILSVRIAELTGGSPLKILVLFSVMTAVLSAFLDNVTTVLIIVPIVVELTAGMGLNPKLYVISQAVISNIGGCATLIGDPPNIIIGSKVGLTFNSFLFNLTLPVIGAFLLALLYVWLRNRQSFEPVDHSLTKLFSIELLLEQIRYNFLNIHIDRIFLIKSLVCLGITILLFVTQTVTGISPGVVTMTMAMLLIIVTRTHIEEVLEEVEWSTLLFFAGLFILVGGLEEKGVMDWIAHNFFSRIGTDPYMMVLAVLWISGIVSGFLDNIPFTIAMIPVVTIMQESTYIPENLLWWALSLGVCLGGNLTMIGASANIVAVGVAAKSKQHISFLEFMKLSMPITILTLGVASVYLIIRLWLAL